VIQAIAFASCYVCSPNGAGAVCERSRLLRALLKAGNADFIRKYALRVHQQAADSTELSGFFDSKDVLVPVPRSAPGPADHLWPAKRLAAALVDAGIGGSTWSGLQRVHAVTRSATAAAGARPTVNSHYESFLVGRPAMPLEKIVLIDDVVTKGRTFLAAASRIHDVMPCAQVRAFALVRTMGMITRVEHLLEPCRGEIRWSNGDARRSP
jgi:hypothetical protein